MKLEIDATKLFDQRSKDNKDVDVGNTNYNHIQEFFQRNLTKVEYLVIHVVLFDHKDILMIRELQNTSHVDPQVKWGPSKFYLLIVRPF